MDANFPRHGEIWLVLLDPVVGGEIGKTRPAIVVSNDRNNQFADTVTVIPVTSKTERIYPFEVFLSHTETQLAQDSKAKANQIRTIDKKRLVKLVAQLPPALLAAVKQAVRIHLEI